MKILQMFFGIAKQYLGALLTALGVAWTVFEVFDHWKINPLPEKCQLPIFLAVIFVTLICYALCDIWQVFFFSCKIGSSCKIRIRIGNILKKKNGTILIGINNELDTNPRRIGDGSIHEQLISKQKDNSLLNEFEKERKQIESLAEMGHSFPWQDGQQSYLFLVMSSLTQAHVPKARSSDLLTAMRKLFDSQDSLVIQSRTLYVPVIGTGEAAVRLSHADVIKLIAREYIISEARSTPENPQRIQTLEIVVYGKDFFNIGFIAEWHSLCQDIRTMAEQCSACIRA